MAISLFCLLVSILLSAALTQPGIQESQTLRSAQTERTHRGDGFSLTYPSNWQAADVEQPVMCETAGVECLLTLGTKAGDGTNINLIRFALDEKATSVEADDMLWAAFEAGTSEVVLESKEIVEIDGLLGVRRVFTAPSSNTSNGRAHLLQIHLVKDDMLYQLTGWAPSAGRFRQNQPAIDEIFQSLRFLLPRALGESQLGTFDRLRFDVPKVSGAAWRDTCHL
jgi:hypothetical protein